MARSLAQDLIRSSTPAMQRSAVPEADAADLESLLPAGRMIFSVQGMFCASCALAVQRIIEKVPGVVASNVNFTSGAALVQWEPDSFDFGTLFERVHRLGYEMSPLLDNNELDRSLQAQAARIRMQLIVGAFFGMWSMLGSWMLYLGVIAVAGIDPLLVGWAATIFSLPVVLYSGLDFYRAGWKTTLAGIPGMDAARSEEHTSELQSRENLVCRLLLEKKKKNSYE